MEEAPDALLLTALGLACGLAGRVLWSELSITLRAGERLGITGVSGAGKSMLLRTLAGLEPLQAGTITFRNRSTSNWPMPDYRSRVVYVPQRPVFYESTVERTLAAPFRFQVHRRKRYSRRRASEVLQSLARDEGFLSRETEHLSAGEAQLVAVLRALLIEPDVLLLDEPTASVDASARDRIESLITDWIKGQTPRACIWTGHDRIQLDRVSDSVMSLEPPV